MNHFTLFLTDIFFAVVTIKMEFGNFPFGPVAKTGLPMHGAWVTFLVRELDPHAENKSSLVAAKAPACC